MTAAFVFCAASAVLFYVLFGYPLLLGLLARRRSRPVHRAPAFPTVSVIIPVYNGEKFLPAKLESLLALDYPRDRIEIIVVSDGSTDRTDEIAAAYAASGVRLLTLPRGGKPAALNAAIPGAAGEFLLLTDVRQTLEPRSLRLLMESFSDPSVGAVSGELLIRQGATPAESDIGLYWRLETWIRDRLSAIDSMFGATGPFYALRRELAVPIPPDTLLDDMYLPLAAFFRGRRLVVDSRARAWDFPTSRRTEFRRKMRTLAGNYQILAAYPGLLGPGNRMWFHFMSYKFGRLLLPHCLIAIAAAAFTFPDPWRAVALLPQALFYFLAAVDPLVPLQFPLKRLTSPARTFLVMMAAILAGLAILFVPARSLWKVTSAGDRL